MPDPDPEARSGLEPASSGVELAPKKKERLLAPYQKRGGRGKKNRRRLSDFRSNALEYYDGHTGSVGDEMVWCHATGSWWISDYVKAAHIVPPLLDDSGGLGEILFGSQAPLLQQAGNSLLLFGRIKRWFESYHLLIVPAGADAAETSPPFERWRVDIISQDIREVPYLQPRDIAGNLDRKHLTFLNYKRPAPCFMYFHFIMGLIRIRDMRRRGWQDVWARYYQERPFPTPGRYMRKSMLLALATHFGTAAELVDGLESWIVDGGFETGLKLTGDESTEAARRVYLAVEEAVARAEKDPYDDDEEEDSDGSEDSEDSDDSEDDEGWRLRCSGVSVSVYKWVYRFEQGQ